MSAAVSLSQTVLNDGQARVDRYLGFLKSGGSQFPAPDPPRGRRGYDQPGADRAHAATLCAAGRGTGEAIGSVIEWLMAGGAQAPRDPLGRISLLASADQPITFFPLPSIPDICK